MKGKLGSTKTRAASGDGNSAKPKDLDRPGGLVKQTIGSRAKNMTACRYFCHE